MCTDRFGSTYRSAGLVFWTARLLLHKEKRLVHPVGFEISEQEAQYHGITQETAARNGIELAEVLAEFCVDLFRMAPEQKV